MKILLIVLIILIILFLLWWFIFRKKCCKGSHEKTASSGGAAKTEASETVSFAAKEEPAVSIPVRGPAEAKEPAETKRSAEPEEPAPVRSAVPENPGKKNLLSFRKGTAEGLDDLHGYRRIIAINVETPNSDNDRICNIGISVGDASGIKSSALRINPEVTLTDVPDGLTAGDILNAPTFPELWPELSALFEDSLVLAHNTSHDLNILKKVLRAYGLKAPGFDYACTYRTSRKFHPEFDNYRLGTICEVYNIPLDTRDAVSHSDACLEIFRHLTAEGQPFFEEAKEFTLD